MSVDLLREFIEAIIESQPWYGERSRTAEEDAAKHDDRIKRGGSIRQTQASGDLAFEEDVLELMEMPEFNDVATFVEYKMDNDEDSYSTAELQALARNIDFNKRGVEGALPSQALIKSVKQELIGWGLSFQGRQPQRHFRGAMSAAHGTSPFAGMGGGGTGFSSGGLGLGTGPGAIGGKTPWNASDKRNLPMGSKRH